MFFKKLKSLLKQVQSDSDSTEVRLPKELFDHLLRAALMGSQFDEKWYLKTYPDVATGIKSKVIASAREHYVNTGYFEGRLPYEIKVDDEFYLRTNEDVKRAMRAKQVKSAREHWFSNGMQEGRDPSENFSLFAK